MANSVVSADKAWPPLTHFSILLLSSFPCFYIYSCSYLDSSRLDAVINVPPSTRRGSARTQAHKTFLLSFFIPFLFTVVVIRCVFKPLIFFSLLLRFVVCFKPLTLR